MYCTGKFARWRPFLKKLPLVATLVFFAAHPSTSDSKQPPSPSCETILARLEAQNRPPLEELPLQEGEFVEIKPENGTGAYLGKFVMQHDTNESIIVRIGDGSRGYLDDTIVPNSTLRPLVAGTQERALKRLKIFDDISLRFAKGEAVRFRDANGDLQSGTFAGKGWKSFKIKTNRGRVSIPRDQVFKNSPPSYSARPSLLGSGGLIPNRPSGILQDVLNGNARLTSLPDYQALDDTQKVRVIMEYNQKILPYVAGSTKAESGATSFDSIDDFICAGAGVCRHKSPLLTSMLRESGFEATTMSLTHPDGTGHVWVEVKLPRDGKMKTFIADPNTPSGTIYLKSMEEVEQTAAANPDSNEAHYHAHPSRRPYRDQN